MMSADLDHEEHVQAPQGDRAVDMEEVDASMVEACERRNWRHVVRLRCGAGGIRSRLRIRRTVDARTR